jgi:CBS domain-containing protein
MTDTLLTFTPETDLNVAIDGLVSRGFSGAPVVENGQRGTGSTLVGILSEKDCLRLVSNEAWFSLNGHELPTGTVGDYMTRDVRTVSPSTDLMTLAHLFIQNPFRRLPVVDDDVLVGLVTRRNVLQGIQIMRSPKSPYPDYRRPQV